MSRSSLVRVAVVALFVLTGISTLFSQQPVSRQQAMTAVARSWSCWTLSRASEAVFGPVETDASCRSYPATASPLRLSRRGQAQPIVAPGAPSGLSASITGRTVVLSWTAGAGDAPTSYVLEAGSASGRTDLANTDTGSPTPSLTATDVPPGSYFIRVRARNASGVSAPSNEIVATVGSTGCTAAPGSPTGMSASVSGTSVVLAWQAPAGGCPPTSYTIEAGSASGLSNLTVFSTGNTNTSLSANNVGSGTYYVRVRAANGGSLSAPSNEAQFTIGAGTCAGPPPAPTGLSATVSGSTVVLTWTAPSGAPTSYVIEAGSASGLADLVVSDTGSAATSLTATAASGTYYVRVRAKSACGSGAASNEAIVTVGGARPTGFTVEWPTAPGDVSASYRFFYPYGVHDPTHGAGGHLGWDIFGRPDMQVLAAVAADYADVSIDSSGLYSVSLNYRVSQTVIFGVIYTNIKVLGPGIGLGRIGAIAQGQVLGTAALGGAPPGLGPVGFFHFGVFDPTVQRFVSPGTYMSAAGLSIFNTIWPAAAYQQELTEPFSENALSVTFPLSRTWQRTSGSLSPIVGFTRPSDQDTITHTYWLADQSGNVTERGSVNRQPWASPYSTIDLTSTSGVTRLGIYDIVDGTMRLQLGDPGAARPTSFTGGSVYTSAR